MDRGSKIKSVRIKVNMTKSNKKKVVKTRAIR